MGKVTEIVAEVLESFKHTGGVPLGRAGKRPSDVFDEVADDDDPNAVLASKLFATFDQGYFGLCLIGRPRRAFSCAKASYF